MFHTYKDRTITHFGQGHPNQSYHSIDVFDWFTDKDWYSAFKLAEQTTIEELMNMEGITEHVAKEKFKRIFWPYHAHHLTQSWESYRKENIEFKKTILSVDGLIFYFVFLVCIRTFIHQCQWNFKRLTKC